MNTLFMMAVLALSAGSDVETDVLELKTSTGTLHGTLDLPPGPGPWPVVVILPGSGPTDRDGNQPQGKTDALKLLGRSLAMKRIACLRIDKRGVAASSAALAKEEDIRLETYADDAAAWVKLLRSDRRFTAVGLVGHSEGALVGLLSGQNEKLDAFVSLCGTGRKAGDILRTQLKDKVSKDLLERSEAIIQLLEAGKTADDIPIELAPVFRKSVQPYLISVLKRDPAVEVGKLDCPVLIVTGTHDLQIPPSEGDVLAAGAKAAKHVTIKNMSHVLKETDKTALLVQALTVYTDPKLPLHPELAGVLADFLTAALGAKK